MIKRYRLLKRSFNEQKLRELVNIFELNTKQRFNTFSKGMRRQAATALALAEENPYIFFDETFDGLDPFKRGFIKKLLKEEAETRGTTVIITSHSLRELEDVCDNLAILDQGNFVLDTDAAEVKTSAVKVQIAYADEYNKERLGDLDIVSFVKRGAVSVAVIRGEEGDVLAKLRETSPLLLEVLPMTLEETFSYNLDERKIVREEEIRG
jgi:ABC-2 type transport system ATP-binding protein